MRLRELNITNRTAKPTPLDRSQTRRTDQADLVEQNQTLLAAIGSLKALEDRLDGAVKVLKERRADMEEKLGLIKIAVDAESDDELLEVAPRFLAIREKMQDQRHIDQVTDAEAVVASVAKALAS